MTPPPHSFQFVFLCRPHSHAHLGAVLNVVTKESQLHGECRASFIGNHKNQDTTCGIAAAAAAMAEKTLFTELGLNLV